MLLSLLFAMGASVRARTTRNVAYASTPGARLDVYAPVGADGEAPVVVFAHSGCLSGGKRHLFRFVGQTLASRGFVTVIPDVRPSDRHAGEPCYLGFLQDVARATAWVGVNAARFGGDPGRLFLMGHAGGAYTVAMLALDHRWLGAVGMKTRDLRGAIGISGLYDFMPADGADARALFGPTEQWPDDLPVDHAHPGAPPLLLIAGQNDRIDPENTSRLARAVRSKSGHVAEIRYPHLGDRLGLRGLGLRDLGLNRLTAWIRYRATALDEVERFVRLYSLGPGA